MDDWFQCLPNTINATIIASNLKIILFEASLMENHQVFTFSSFEASEASCLSPNIASFTDEYFITFHKTRIFACTLNKGYSSISKILAIYVLGVRDQVMQPYLQSSSTKIKFYFQKPALWHLDFKRIIGYVTPTTIKYLPNVFNLEVSVRGNQRNSGLFTSPKIMPRWTYSIRVYLLKSLALSYLGQ